MSAPFSTRPEDRFRPGRLWSLQGYAKSRSEKSSTQTKLSEHETNRGEVEKSERVSGEIFEILGQPAAAIKPSEVRSTTQRRGRSSNPFARSERLTISICRCGRFWLKPLKDRALISAISKELLQKWIQTEQSGENKHAAVTILNIGWMHNSMKQQA